MKISEYNKLEKKINDQNFNKSYKNLNYVLGFLSYFGNIISIFLAYFLLSKILKGAITDNPSLVFIISIILLSGLELLKRDLANKFSSQYLKIKSFTKDVWPLFILTMFIIILSFYSSINGAKEFSSKSDIIEKNKNEMMLQFKDSVEKSYNLSISEVQGEIKEIKDKIENKDKEQTEIESSQPLTKSQKSRVKDIKDEKSLLRNDISKLEGDISDIKAEMDAKIKNKELELNANTNQEKESNKDNSIAFIVISFIIEIVILAGIYFTAYYNYRSYREKRDLLEKDSNYQKWKTYDKMLSILYDENAIINQKFHSGKAIIDLCKVNSLNVLQTDVVNFLKVINSLGIIKTSGSNRYINKQRDLSFEVLKKHFNIE